MNKQRCGISSFTAHDLNKSKNQALPLQKPFKAAKKKSQNILALNAQDYLVAMEVFLTRAKMTDEMQVLQCITVKVLENYSISEGKKTSVLAPICRPEPVKWP